MAAETWWAVEAPAGLRTGQRMIDYIQASSRQQAGETEPGSTVLGGPYPSEAAAQAAFPQGSHGTTPSHTGPPVVSDKPVPLPNPLSGLDQIGAALRSFWDAITDGAMWISLGWLIAGLVLLIIGVSLWMKLPQQVSRLGPAGLL